MIPLLWQKIKRKEIRRLLIWVKEESKKKWPETQHSKIQDHGNWSHHFIANRWGNNGNSERLFVWAPK